MIKLSTLEQYLDDAEDASHDARLSSELCRDFYDGKQWTDAEEKELKRRNQPPIVFNMVQPKVDFLLGLEKQTRTDPKAYPRTPDHDEAAAAATDGIRYVLDNNDFDSIASDQFEYMDIEGTGGVAVEVDPKTFNIEIKKLAWNRLFIDPHAMNKIPTDARYMGYISWKDMDEVIEKWPKAKSIVTKGVENATNIGDTKDDKPTRWYSAHRKRVMCVDICFKHNGVWHNAIFVKGAYLEEAAPSTYVNDEGVPQNKFIIASAKVDRDGNRYGPTKNDLDKQREVNKRRSKAQHLLNTRQTFAREGALGDKTNDFKSEANKPDGHLTYPGSGEFGKDFGVIPNEALAGPQFDMYLEAKASLDMAGANQALQGTIDKTLSGKAIKSLQAGGMLELAPLFDTHSQWKKLVYRAIWDRIKQFWKAEKWVRVTDNEDDLRWVGLNVPITQAVQMVMERTGMKASEVQDKYKPELQELYRQQPEMAQEVEVVNAVAEMDVDIIIEEVPDMINVQSEQFDMLVAMYQANPWSQENPDGIKWEHVIQMSQLRDKERILGKDITPEEQEAAAAQAQMLEQQKALNDMAMQIELGLKQSQINKNNVDAEAQALENAIVQAEFPNTMADKQSESRKKAGDAEYAVSKAIQTDVETGLLLTSPAPNKVAVI